MRRRLPVWWIVLTLVPVAVVVVDAVADDYEDLLERVVAVGIGVLFVAAGLVAWTKRPGSVIARLIAYAGLAWLWAGVLTGSTNAVVFTAGLFVGSLTAGLLAHLAVAYPSGRLTSPSERAVVVAAYAAAVAFVTVDRPDPGYPPNLVQLSAERGVGRAVEIAILVLTLPVIAAFVATLVGHWRGAGSAGRRTLAPIVPGACLVAVLSGVSILEQLGLFSFDSRWGVVQLGLLVAVPLVFLASVLRSYLDRAGVGGLVVELGDTGPRGQLRPALARALRDPSVEVAYWLADRAGYVDSEGRPLELPAGGSRRSVTVIERGGERVGALVHDAILGEEPALVEAAAAAVGMAMENERLHAEVLARLEEVRASRARIVEAGDAERRRVERNLHDGAQQRLVGLSLALAMARQRLPPEPGGGDGVDTLLAEASEELALALRELRELARGIHPAILSEVGLRGAVESLAERAPVPVSVRAEVEAEGRLPPAVEVAAYFVISESLANVAKYARATSVTVTVTRRDGRLRVEVADDGVGGACGHAGSGLEGLGDRVAALDGTLEVDSPPGGGTRVTAEVPCG